VAAIGEEPSLRQGAEGQSLSEFGDDLAQLTDHDDRLVRGEIQWW
jgi:hypothetical protein